MRAVLPALRVEASPSWECQEEIVCPLPSPALGSRRATLSAWSWLHAAAWMCLRTTWRRCVASGCAWAENWPACAAHTVGIARPHVPPRPAPRPPAPPDMLAIHCPLVGKGIPGHLCLPLPGPAAHLARLQVPRLQSSVRDRRANWAQSLGVLRAAKEAGARVTKTSIMLGCGERPDEVVEALRLLRWASWRAGCACRPGHPEQGPRDWVSWDGRAGQFAARHGVGSSPLARPS